MDLPEVLDLPPEVRQDPIWSRSSGAEFGRDGCRVPLPWRPDAPNFGFSDGAWPAAPWLPQPAEFSRYCAEELRREPGSVYATYSAAIAARSPPLRRPRSPRVARRSSGRDRVSTRRHCMCREHLGRRCRDALRRRAGAHVRAYGRRHPRRELGGVPDPRRR